jgi:hypothetical protein
MFPLNASKAQQPRQRARPTHAPLMDDLRRVFSLPLFADAETQVGTKGMGWHCGLKPSPSMSTLFPHARLFRQDAALMDLAMCEQRKDRVWQHDGDSDRSWRWMCAVWWGSDFVFNDGVILSRERGCHQAKEAGKGPRGSNMETSLHNFALTKDGDCMQMVAGRDVFSSKTVLPTSIANYDRAHTCARDRAFSVLPFTVKLDEPTACAEFWAQPEELKKMKGVCKSSRYFVKPLGEFGGRGIFTYVIMYKDVPNIAPSR